MAINPHGIAEALKKVTALHVGGLKHLRNAQNGACGDAKGVQLIFPLLRRLCCETGLKSRAQGVTVGFSVFAGAVGGIVSELVAAKMLAQCGPLLVFVRGND